MKKRMWANLCIVDDIFRDDGVYLEVLFFGVHDVLLLVISAVGVG